MARFQDSVAIVTGAASGIGLATAQRLGSEGRTVVVADLDRAKTDAAADQIRRRGRAGRVGRHLRRGRRSAGGCDRAGERWTGGRGSTSSSTTPGVMVFKPLEEHVAADWRKVLDVDLLGAFFFIRQAFLHMKPGGAVVNVASVHAVETTPNVASYAAAKAALVSLTRSAALEGKPKGIRVNAVLPGAVDTPMLWDNPNVRSGVEQVDRAYVGKPEDVAATIAYLASDDAAFVQGAMVRVDGGRLGRL